VHCSGMRVRHVALRRFVHHRVPEVDRISGRSLSSRVAMRWAVLQLGPMPHRPQLAELLRRDAGGSAPRAWGSGNKRRPRMTAMITASLSG
jgi:hypothetical protein